MLRTVVEQPKRSMFDSITMREFIEGGEDGSEQWQAFKWSTPFSMASISLSSIELFIEVLDAIMPSWSRRFSPRR